MERQPERSTTPRSRVLGVTRFVVVVAITALTVVFFIASSSAASAGGTDEGDGADAPSPEEGTTEGESAVDAEADALLREGADVYSQICSSCHQPGGAGLSGTFPPLIDNPNVEDAEYVADVINSGMQGELTVLGETYNGVMPSFSTLSDGDVDAVVAYLQADFAVPTGDEEVFADSSSDPVAGTDLPFFADASALIAYLLAACVAALVLAPRLIGVNDRLDTPWLDVGLKTATIVLAIVFATVVLPDWVLQTSAVSGLDRIAQDLLGLALWGAGLVACLAGLWWAHRESRI